MCLTEQKLGRDNPISAQLDRKRHGKSDGRTRFPRELRETVYRHLLNQIQRLDPGLEVGLCLEEDYMFDALGMSASLGRCNCVL
jgi:spore photoproduct lyase